MKKIKGFTLIELMIVVAVIFVIAVLGGSVFVGGHFIAKFW
jgi:prepilin-type N-terminal cleavage/methylation domain-containing protein